MKTSRLLSVLTIVALVLGMCVSASAAGQCMKGQSPFIYTGPVDLKGKTVILHSNDVHGAIEGYAAVAGLRKQYEAMGAEVIVVDAGDFIQGTVYVGMSEGHSAVDMMNAVGYDLVTLGNHDFDYGCESLISDLRDADFSVVCANVRDVKSDESVWHATHVIETGSGMRIGFFGVTTPETEDRLNFLNTKNVAFVPEKDTFTFAQNAIDSMSDTDLVIGLIHLGMTDGAIQRGISSIDLWNSVTGVDFLIDGHSHTIMTQGPNGEPIQSTGNNFECIGVIVIDNTTKTIENHYLLSVDRIEKDAEIDATAHEIIAAVDVIYCTEFATTEVFLSGEKDDVFAGESNLGGLVAEALAWYAKREFADRFRPVKAVVGVTNAFTIFGSINEGGFSMNDVKRLNRYDNLLTVVFVTGAELLEALEASTFCTPIPTITYPQTYGFEWSLDTSVPYESGELYTFKGRTSTCHAPAAIRRVSITSVDGEPFDPKALYAVATNDFIVAAGDTYNAFGRAFLEGRGFCTNVLLDEAVVAFITDELGGKVTEKAYGKPSGAQTRIGVDETPEA